MNTDRRSWEKLYLVIGILGIILPILDVWKCQWQIPPSISESYYLGAIVPFVVILGGLGIVFFCNEGFDRIDQVCNTISGMAAIGVISFPCDSTNKLFSLIPFPYVHYTSAVILFLTFSIMCGLVFTRERCEGAHQINYMKTKNKRIRNIIYKVCSLLIIFGMAVAKLRNIFWGEVIMLEAFGFAYMVQGKIIFRDKKL